MIHPTVIHLKYIKKDFKNDSPYYGCRFSFIENPKKPITYVSPNDDILKCLKKDFENDSPYSDCRFSFMENSNPKIKQL
jgi:hypothetical protein